MRIVGNSIVYGLLAVVGRHSFGWFLKRVAGNCGMAYIKMSQILSTRTDLLSAESIAELRDVNDNVNPVSYEEIVSIIEQEYGCPISESFAEFEEKPVGSASVSQVHRAVLKDGREVAVKVKRVELLDGLDKDLRFMKRAVGVLAVFSKKVRFVKKSGVMDDYFGWIVSETDFAREEKNLKKMYDYTTKLNRDSRGKTIALYVHEKLCTENIIVMDFVAHATLNKVKDARSKEFHVGLNDYLRSCFYALFNYDKFVFHGDPHAGNIFFDEQGNMGMLDYGLVFELDKKECEIIRKLALLMYRRDAEGLEKMILRLSGKYCFAPNEWKRERKLRYDLQMFLASIEDLPVTTWFINMALIMMHNNLNGSELRFFYRFGKAMATFDGIMLMVMNNTDGRTLLETQFRRYHKIEQLDRLTKDAGVWLEDLAWIVGRGD